MYQVSKGPVGCTVTTYDRRGLILRGVGEPELHQLSPPPSCVYCEIPEAIISRKIIEFLFGGGGGRRML